MKIREVASGLQFPEGPVALADGSVLLVEIARGTLSRVTPDGRVQVVAQLGGGPNGAAIGPDGAVYVCNNGGFRWTDQPGNCLRPIGQPGDYSGGRIERVGIGLRAPQGKPTQSCSKRACGSGFSARASSPTTTMRRSSKSRASRSRRCAMSASSERSALRLRRASRRPTPISPR